MTTATKFRRRRVWIPAAALGLAAGLLSAVAAADAPPALQDLRRNMFDPAVGTLTNRTIELVFDVARVEAGGDVWVLPEDRRPLDFTYEAGGETRSAEHVLQRTHTDAMIILKDGRIVYEAYLNMTRETTHFMSYSMAKTFNAILTGLAIEDGAIESVRVPVTRYAPELEGTGYDGATLEDLLEMRSGVDWNDNFFVPGPSRDAHIAAFVENSARYTDWAQDTTRAYPPGEVFNYNTMDAALVGLVLERALGRAISDYMSERLWKPAGMQSYAFYVLDGPPGVGREFSGGGFNAVLRDYARIGQMMLDGGVANGRQVLPVSWVDQSTRPSSAGEGETGEPGLGYAYFWWTIEGAGAYTALGGEGQYLYVDPDTETVIVKLSHAPTGPDFVPIQAENLAFFRAASLWSPD